MSGYPALEALADSGTLEPDVRIELVIALADLARLRHHVESLLEAAGVVVAAPWSVPALVELAERCRMAGASPAPSPHLGIVRSWDSDDAAGRSAGPAAPAAPGSTTGVPSPAGDP